MGEEKVNEAEQNQKKLADAKAKAEKLANKQAQEQEAQAQAEAQAKAEEERARAKEEALQRKQAREEEIKREEAEGAEPESVLIEVSRVRNRKYLMSISEHDHVAQGESLAECLSNLLKFLRNQVLQEEDLELSSEQVLKINNSDLAFGKLSFKDGE